MFSPVLKDFSTLQDIFHFELRDETFLTNSKILSASYVEVIDFSFVKSLEMTGRKFTPHW